MAGKFTLDQMLEAIRDSRGFVATASRLLGCSIKTVERYADKHPEIAEEIRHQKELMLDEAEGKLYDAIKKGQPWAICFFLKCQGKHRHYSERLQVTDGEGKPLAAPQIIVASEHGRELTGQIIDGCRTLPAGSQN